MTHKGRMLRGEANFKAGLLDNADTQYYLDNKPKKEAKPKKKEDKKEAKEE